MYPNKNGSFDQVSEELEDVKHSLTDSIEGLSSAIRMLSTKIDTLVTMYQHAVPIKVVWWMFIILLASLLGVEGIKEVFKHNILG